MQSLLQRALTPHTIAKVSIAAAVVALPSLAIGFLVDDYLHRISHLRTPPFGEYFPEPLYLFSILSGSAESTQRLVDYGLFPWWTTTSIHVSFWRPLTVFTHMADYALWPDSPLLMHLHSILWYVAVAAVAAVLFRRIEGATWIAGLAAFIYAIDEAHAVPVGWLANRNALVAAFFGIVCVIFHDVWRREEKTWAAAASVLALAAAIHAKEEGLATTAYLFAYAVFLDRATLRTRAMTLVPYGMVVLGWRAYYSALGFGAKDSPLYIDPVQEPLRFAAAVIERMPALLLGQWFNFPTEILQASSLGVRFAFAGIAIVVLMGLFALMRPVVLQSPQSRFWLTGVLISLIPMCAVGATNRVLLFAGLGGSALLAGFLTHVFGSAQVSRAQRWLARGFFALHLVIAPIVFVVTLLGVAWLGRAIDRGIATAEFPPGVESKTVLLVNSPTYFLSIALPLKRSLDGDPMPEHFYTLSPNSLVSVPIELVREDERTLRVTPEGGFPVLVFRSVEEPFTAGDRIKLPGMTVEILKTDAEGKALSVAYHFDRPLDDDKFVWVRMRGLGYEPFTPPPLGESIIE